MITAGEQAPRLFSALRRLPHRQPSIGLSTGSFADDNSGTELTGNNYAASLLR